MRLLSIFAFILYGFVLIQTTHVFAEDIKTIKVTSAQWKGYTNKDGTGVYWEVVKAIYEPLGINVQTWVMPWKRAELTALTKNVDALLGAYYHKDKNFLYPKWHISVEDPIMVIFKKENLSDWEKKGIGSLKDKTVAWMRGYSFEKTLLKNVTVKKQELDKVTYGLGMLSYGRIDALIDYESEIRPWAKKNNINLEKDYSMKIAKLGNKLFLAFANTEKSRKLIKIFDERMTHLVKSGEIEKIYLKWGHSKKKFGKDRYGKD